MWKIRQMLILGLTVFLCSCGDSDQDRKERAEQFTTSTKAAPRPRQEEISDLLRPDRHTPITPLGAPKFELFSLYQGSDINQVTGVSGRSLLLCFTAPWCPYSAKMRTSLQDLAKKEKGSVQVVEVNADAYPALARQFHITRVPTTILYTEGVKLRTIEGSYTADSLRAYLHKVLSQADAPTS